MARHDREEPDGITLLSILLILAAAAIVLGVGLPLFLGGHGEQAGAAAKDKLSTAYAAAAATRSSDGDYAAAADIAAAISRSDTDEAPVIVDSISAMPVGQTALISSGTSNGPGSRNSKNIEMAYQDSDGVVWILRSTDGGPPLYSSVTPDKESYAQMVGNDNPLSYWPLDDQSGPLAANNVEGAPSGTYFGGVAMSQGQVDKGGPGAAVGLNGSTGYIDLGPQSDPEDYTAAGGSGWSTELWVKMDDLSTQQFIWSRYLAGKNAGAGTYIYYDPDKGFVCGTALGDGKYPIVDTEAGSVDAGRWYHIVCELDPKQKTKNIMYVNNTRYVTDWATSMKNVMPPKTPYDHLLGQNDASSWLDGYLSNVAFYAYPLSSTTVAAHYAKGTSAGQE